MKCPECGVINSAVNKECSNCQADLRKKREKAIKKSAQAFKSNENTPQNRALMLLGMGIALTVLGLLFWDQLEAFPITYRSAPWNLVFVGTGGASLVVAPIYLIIIWIRGKKKKREESSE